MVAEQDDIKTMKLYNGIDRIEKELQVLGIGKEDPLSVEQLSAFDSMHYGGNDAVREAITVLGKNLLDNDSTLLDIGSGFGGPARFLAHSASGVKVVAMELQADIHNKAAKFTRRCQLDDKVSHYNGNILECDLSTVGGGAGSFDAVVSWLTFLHIPDKKRLFTICASMLKDSAGSSLYLEDYYMREPFTSAEKESLAKDVYCSDLPTKQEYIASLESCGFHEIDCQDQTKEWTVYVQDRVATFKADRVRFVALHGESSYERLLHFYEAVAALFEGGHLGGIRLHALKKTP